MPKKKATDIDSQVGDREQHLRSDLDLTDGQFEQLSNVPGSSLEQMAHDQAVTGKREAILAFIRESVAETAAEKKSKKQQDQ